MAWEQPDLDTDPDAVTERILENMRGRMPGWEPVEGAPEVALAEEIGRETAGTNELAATSLNLAWASVGETIYEVLPYQPLPATLPDVQIDFTPVAPGPAGLADSTIPAGFTI